MKKILLLLFALLLMVGCGSSSSSKLSEEDFKKALDGMVEKANSVENSKTSIKIDTRFKVEKTDTQIKVDANVVQQKKPTEMAAVDVKVDGLEKIEPTFQAQAFKFYSVANPKASGSYIVIVDNNGSYQKQEVKANPVEGNFVLNFKTEDAIMKSIYKTHKYTPKAETINGVSTNLLEYDLTKEALEEVMKLLPANSGQSVSSAEITKALTQFQIENIAHYKVYYSDDFTIYKAVLDFKELADAFKAFVQIDNPVIEFTMDYKDVKVELPAEVNNLLK